MYPADGSFAPNNQSLLKFEFVCGVFVFRDFRIFHIRSRFDFCTEQYCILRSIARASKKCETTSAKKNDSPYPVDTKS